MADETPRATERRSPPRGPADFDAPFTEEELAFLRAVEEFKRRNRRPFPTWREVLGILKSLGYRRDEGAKP